MNINKIISLGSFILPPLLIVSGLSMNVSKLDLNYIFFGLLTVSLLMAAFQFKHVYSLLRVSLAFGAGFLSVSLISSTVFSALLANSFSQLSRKEFNIYATAIAILTVPFFVGLLAVIGPRHSYVRAIGRILTHGISPGIFIWGVFTHSIDWGSHKTFWIISLVVSSAICWELLIWHLSKMPNKTCMATPTSPSVFDAHT